MRVNRGIWLILAAVVLVVIGLFVRPTANRAPEAPPAAQTPVAQTPAATTAVQSATDAADTSSAQAGGQKLASAPPPKATAQTAQVETAPAQQPMPSPKTAEQATSPTPATTTDTRAAPESEKAGEPASPSTAAVQTAAKEPAPPPPPQPDAKGTVQMGEEENSPVAAPSATTTPAAPTVEKESFATDKDVEAHANEKARTELAALQPGFVPKDLVTALNDSVISFASDSAEVPASTTDFLQKAAEDLKQLPKGHVVEIAGYTDSSGDQALNIALSQKRAEAVRETLIKFGADPEMLIAKGYGSADPVASNETPQGRQRNRRIEYHIIKAP